METRTSSQAPNLTKSFLDYFLTLPLSDKTIVEIGSAPWSHKFWQSKCKTLYSYEDDLTYFKQTMYPFDHEYYKNSNFIKHLAQADYVIIDNEPNRIPRYDFPCFVPRYTKGQIILDNSYWHLKAHNYLCKLYFNKDFAGKNKENDMTVTTLYDVKKDTNYQFYNG